MILVAVCVRLDAQQAPQGAAYWQEYVATVKPNSTVAVRLDDGTRFQGWLVAATADAMVIRVKRSFRRSVERRVQYDAVNKLSRLNQYRNMIIGGAIGLGVGVLFVIGAS